MVFDRHNGIYRSIILAFAGLILLGANSPSQNSTGDPPAAQSNENSTQNTNIAASISRIGSALEAQNAKTDPYEKQRNKREIRDLQAQENSAYWAKAMFWATVVAVILSVIGIVLIYITFKATRRSADASHAQTRAYVRIKGAVGGIANNQSWFAVSNNGLTPAADLSILYHYDVFLDGELWYCSLKEQRFFGERNEPLEQYITTNESSPCGIHFTEGLFSPISEASSYANRKIFIKYTINYTYKTIFNTEVKVHTMFRHDLIWQSDRNGTGQYIASSPQRIKYQEREASYKLNHSSRLAALFSRFL